MQEINNSYYIENSHSQFYRLARMRQQQDVLNRMQQTYDLYSSSNINQEHETPKQPEQNNEVDKKETSKNNTHNDINLSNIANILGGNADFSKILLNALSGQNKDLANILKIFNNPLIKNSFSKKHKPVVANISGDEISQVNEIDSYEKIIDN